MIETSIVPFHDNHDTPAARCYKNPEGDALFCYSERRLYKASDFITKGLINYRLETVFYKIWRQLDQLTQESIIQSYGNPIDYLPELWKEHSDKLDGFKEGKLTYENFLDIVLVLLK